MKSVNEVKVQINGLVQGIRECNFIPWHTKQDIVQDTWVKIIQKYNEGVIVDDATQIRGYVFQVLRNFCLAYHRDKDKRRYTPLTWDVREDLDVDREEYHLKLKEIVELKIQAVKYTEDNRKYVQMVFDNKSLEEIKEELDFTTEEFRSMKSSISKKMRSDLKKDPKYMIRNVNNPNVQIGCFTSGDLLKFFKGKTRRQITYMITANKITPLGYYIEALRPIRRGKSLE